MYKVITHNGKAHMDELLAIALLSIHNKELPTEIIRIHPNEAIELISENSKDTYFIDCGLQFNPDKGHFDHHQSKDMPCAALLVFETYFKDLFNSKLHDYIKLVSSVDTKGPNSLDDFKYKSDTISYFSFPQKILLREFEDSPLLISKIFLDGITSIIDFEKEKELASIWMEQEENIKQVVIDNVNILIYNTPPPSELSGAVKAVDGDIVDENNIHVIYSYDKEDNTVRTLFRTFKGDDKVDFSKSTVNNTQFCHKGGFLLKFRPKDENEWSNIIKEAIK